MTNLASVMAPGLTPVMAPVRPRWNWFLAPLLAVALMAVSGAANAQTAPDSFAVLAEKLLPSVVNISTTQVIEGRPGMELPKLPPGSPFEDFFKEFFDRNQPEQRSRRATSLGSGFIVGAEGYVVTNNHVIQDADEITVILHDNTRLKATLVGRDKKTDIAVLKVEPKSKLTAVKFGDSDAARVGDWVIAIGNPFGLGGTVTQGIISAVYRNTGSGSAYDRYLQTDASINRGNSGGPMFDMAGNVIGINNAIFSPTGGSVGIGFAIPAEIAAPIVEKLRAGQAIDRGYLGVRIQALSDDLAASLGLPKKRGEFIQAVEPGQAAAKAGIQAGDVVVKVDGKDVTPDQTLSFIVANTAPGKRIPVELLRNGQRITVQAVVGKRPSEEELAQQSFDPDAQQDDDSFGAPKQQQGPGVLENSLGVVAIPLTPQIARQLGVSEDTRGVVISAVSASSDAAAKGLQRGDIVLSANYTNVTSVAEFERIVRAAKADGREAVLLRIQRRGQPPIYTPVRIR